MFLYIKTLKNHGFPHIFLFPFSFSQCQEKKKSPAKAACSSQVPESCVETKTLMIFY